MRSLKWVFPCVAFALLIAVTVGGTLANQSADEKLYIVQSELQRTASGLSGVDSERVLLPGVYEQITKENVSLQDTFTVIDKTNNAYTVPLSANVSLFSREVVNAIDHIVVVTNTGNVSGYIRTWFAFEMGDLSEAEFKETVLFNRDEDHWTWGAFQYEVQINGKNYAVVCAEYKEGLSAGATTTPSLLQILLSNKASSEVVQRLDGDGDCKFKIMVFSQAVNGNNAWGGTQHPWNAS